jgi:hypothetical protein
MGAKGPYVACVFARAGADTALTTELVEEVEPARGPEDVE